MGFVLRAALTGVALWVVTMLVPGISIVGGDSTLQRVGIIFIVAVVFGLVNAIIKPIVQLFAIPLYILTLGLIHVLNSWRTGTRKSTARDEADTRPLVEMPWKRPRRKDAGDA